MRQIVLDTETTGIDPKQGHRIIEIGCVELINRRPTGRSFHEYIYPEREVEAEAIAVHGLTNEFLADKPLFAEIMPGFLDFIRGAELVIHNAPFDVGFMDHEFALADPSVGKTKDFCQILDSLVLARKQHPGQRNSLDALCKRYEVDNTQRDYHGALLDAQLLADVYLGMTGGQTSLSLAAASGPSDAVDQTQQTQSTVIKRPAAELPIIYANEDELDAHQQQLEVIAKVAGSAVWQRE